MTVTIGWRPDSRPGGGAPRAPSNGVFTFRHQVVDGGITLAEFGA